MFRGSRSIKNEILDGHAFSRNVGTPEVKQNFVWGRQIFLWKLLHVTLLAPIILKWLLDFRKKKSVIPVVS